MAREEILSKAKPILFNTEMVGAILDGRKTVTRRLIKPPAEVHECTDGIFVTRPRKYPDEYCRFEPYWPINVGDILYVRETFFEFKGHYYYKADGKHTTLDKLLGRPFFKWRPSIHMPKDAARIFLRVMGVRLERLQDIDDEGAKAEGANWRNGKNVGENEKMRRPPIDRFAEIWNSTIKKTDINNYGWEANPWVWVISFERVEVIGNIQDNPELLKGSERICP